MSLLGMRLLLKGSFAFILLPTLTDFDCIYIYIKKEEVREVKMFLEIAIKTLECSVLCF